MGKNRNWQNRVENAQARRQETKQRKQKSGDKRAFKGWVSDLLTQLDRYKAAIQSRKATIHIWTDAIPSSSPPLLDLLQDHSETSPNRRSGRGRSASIESEGSAGGGGGGGGRNHHNNKKKVHPRSKEATESSAGHEDNSGSSNYFPLLCQRHFLFGKCDGFNSGKKSTCKYFHYCSKKYLSLGSVLKSHKQNHAQNYLQIQAVEAAIISSKTSAGGEDSLSPDYGSMDMLYYASIRPCVENEASSLHDEIADELSKAQVPMASIVYMTIEDVLVYDRNQGGVLSNALERVETMGRGFRTRQSSLGSESDLPGVDATQLPGTIIEHILTYLPDTAVASCCQVCRSWNREIGQHSPNLWKHLLARHHWLQATTPQDDDDDDPSGQLSKTLFQSHYVAMRDARALASAVPAISPTGGGRTAPAVVVVEEQREVTFQSFASRKHAPQRSDACVALEHWSPNHVLAGYAHECTLRLFQAVPFYGRPSSAVFGSTGTSTEKRLKELVCMSVDPYKSTKKRTCTLDAVGLDDDTIGCLCHVSANNVDASAFVLVVLRRDDFLLGESSAVAAKGGGGAATTTANGGSVTNNNTQGGDLLQVIDVGEAVLNFILCSDVVDHRLLPLFDYLTDSDGEVGDISTSVSRSCITACGYGRFMVEVSISIPQFNDDDEHENDDDDEVTSIQLDRKLVLFSANTNAIVWMGDSYPAPTTAPPAAMSAVVASLRRPHASGSSRQTCSIVVQASSVSQSLLFLDIEPSGEVNVPRIVDNSESVRASFLTNGLPDDNNNNNNNNNNNYQAYPSRCLIVSPSDIIAKDTVYRNGENGELLDLKSTLSFFSRPQQQQQLEQDDDDDDELLQTHSILELKGKVRIHEMVCLGNDYVLAIGTKLVERSLSLGSRGDNNNADDDLHEEGQWFTPISTSPREVHTLILIHIPSRQEIGRIPLFGTGSDFISAAQPRLAAHSQGTVALALGGLGIALTGHDVRGLQPAGAADFSLDLSPSPKKTKKTARSKKNTKKDGFARGLSLRG